MGNINKKRGTSIGNAKQELHPSRILLLAALLMICASMSSFSASAQALSGKTIAIEAGHGTPAGTGCNAGAPGEAEIVQDVAMKLKAMVESEGGNAVMTRVEDCSGGSKKNLEKRAGKALKADADVIIDIHSDCLNCKGSKVIIHCPSADKYREKCDWSAGSAEDKKLGEIIARKFGDVSNKPLKKYSQYLYFLRKASESDKAATALIELSNTDDPRLNDDGFRQKLAELLLDSIKEYAGTQTSTPQGVAAVPDIGGVQGNLCIPGSSQTESITALSEGAGINIQESTLNGGRSYTATLDPRQYVLRTVTADEVLGKRSAPLKEIIGGVPDSVAAINGVYFEPDFSPTTDIIAYGELIEGRGDMEEENFFVVEDGMQKIITAEEFRSYSDEQMSSVSSAVSDFRTFIKKGSVVVRNDKGVRQRASICITENGEIKLFAAERATSLQFAEYMKNQHKCTRTIALDGGSSTSLEYHVSGRDVSIRSGGETKSFSDSGRSIPMALVAVKKKRQSAGIASSSGSASQTTGQITGSAVNSITGMPVSSTGSSCPDFSMHGGKERGFFSKYWDDAVAASRGSIELAKFTLAQAALESGYGSSGLTKNANNFFGVKGSGDAGSYRTETTEYYEGKRTTVTADFAKYSSATESFRAHIELLEKSRHSSKRREMFGTSDITKLTAPQILEATREAGYATDPYYISKVMPIIRKLDESTACMGGMTTATAGGRALRCVCEYTPDRGGEDVSAGTGQERARTVSGIIDELTSKYYNTEYQLGGSTPGRGIDCSGWVHFLVNEIRERKGMEGLGSGHGPLAEQWGSPKYSTMISESEARPGDIVLLDRPSGGTNNWMSKRTWDHVLMIYGKGGELWTSESGGGSHLKDRPLKEFMKIRRAQQEKKPGMKIGFARPKGFDSFTKADLGGGNSITTAAVAEPGSPDGNEDNIITGLVSRLFGPSLNPMTDRTQHPTGPAGNEASGTAIETAITGMDIAEDNLPDYDFSQIDHTLDDSSDWDKAKGRIKEYEEHITEMNEHYDLPAGLIKGIIAVESGGDPTPFEESEDNMFCNDEGCVCNKNGYCGLMRVGPATESGLGPNECEEETCKWDDFIKGMEGAGDQIGAGAISLKNTIKECSVVPETNGDYYYWISLCYRYGEGVAKEIRSLASEREDKMAEEIKWEDITLEDAEDLAESRGWSKEFAEGMYEYPSRVMAAVKRAVTREGDSMMVEAGGSPYVCEYKPVDYMKIGEYYANPSFRAETDYDPEVYSKLIRTAKEIIHECKDESSDGLRECVKEAVDDRREIDDDLLLFNGPCDYQENMISDFAEWTKACAESESDQCTCEIPLEYEYEKEDSSEEVTISASGSGKIKITSETPDASYSFPGSVEDSKRIRTESGVETLYAKKDGNTLTFTDDDSGTRCEVEKRNYKLCVRTESMSSVYDPEKRRAVREPIEYKFALDFKE
ncbi:MAG: glucosaminidase domain-containing protein [Candidatus Woesearchaeota archaeon]